MNWNPKRSLFWWKRFKSIYFFFLWHGLYINFWRSFVFYEFKALCTAITFISFKNKLWEVPFYTDLCWRIRNGLCTWTAMLPSCLCLYNRILDLPSHHNHRLIMWTKSLTSRFTCEHIHMLTLLCMYGSVCVCRKTYLLAVFLWRDLSKNVGWVNTWVTLAFEEWINWTWSHGYLHSSDSATAESLGSCVLCFRAQDLVGGSFQLEF